MTEPDEKAGKSEKLEDKPRNRVAGDAAENREIQQARSVSSFVMKAVEEKRTGKSSGSFNDKNDESVQIEFGDGQVASRKNPISEKQADHSKSVKTYEVPLHAATPTRTQHSPGASPEDKAPPPSQSEISVPKPPTLSPILVPRPVKIEPPQPVMPPSPSRLEVVPLPQPVNPFEKVLELQNARQDLGVKRTELESKAAEAIRNPVERQQFLVDMRSFETNFEKRSTRSEADKLKEIAETYSQIGRLLSAGGDVLDKFPGQCAQKPNDTPWRIQAAQQVLHQAADPFSINQGRLAVCPTEALQVRQYYRCPSAPAQLVADVLLTGEFKSKLNDLVIKASSAPNNLIPDNEARLYSIDKLDKTYRTKDGGQSSYNYRSYASQVFDGMAINLVVSEHGYLYNQQPRDGNESLGQGMLLSSRGGRNLQWKDALAEGKSVCDEDLRLLNERITGTFETGFVIAAAPLTESEGRDPHVRKIFEFVNRGSGISYLYHPHELATVLRTIEQDGQWPPIISVATGRAPLGAESGSHSFVISALSTDGKSLAYDNTWGKSKDFNGMPTVSTQLVGEAARAPSLIRSSQYGNIRHALTSSKQAYWADFLKHMSNATGDSAVRSQAKLGSAAYQLMDDYRSQWLKNYPNDRSLRLWKLSLDAWFLKYPDELPPNNR